MPSVVPLELRQGNDEIVSLVITPANLSDDLSVVTKLVMLIKPDPCTADTDTAVTTLSTDDPAQMVITSQTATKIEATAYVPASALAAAYGRWWRCDAYVGTAKRTAMYGAVTVIDL